jgi:hypothetical protein
MVRHSRRNRRGGDKIDDILSRLDGIKDEIRGLKSSDSSTTVEESIMEETKMPEMMSETTPETMPETMLEETKMPEPVVETPILKTWVDDKNKKFKDGAGGRVSLAFGRIMTLLDNNINKGNDKKDWVSIKRDLNNANSVEEVQDVINRYTLSFTSNLVAGTRKRKSKKGGKRRTHRRH